MMKPENNKTAKKKKNKDEEVQTIEFFARTPLLKRVCTEDPGKIAAETGKMKSHRTAF